MIRIAEGVGYATDGDEYLLYSSRNSLVVEAIDMALSKKQFSTRDWLVFGFPAHGDKLKQPVLIRRGITSNRKFRSAWNPNG
jgi:hypothetical protein